MTKQFQIWQWLVNNGAADADTIGRALDFTNDSVKRHLQTLRTRGHVTPGRKIDHKTQIKYSAVPTKAPAEDGLYSAAQARRRNPTGERVTLQWEGLTRRELNPLITMPLIRIETEALKGAV